MSPRRHLLALATSIAIVGLLVFGLAFLQYLSTPGARIETVHRIDMAVAMPPPPPPPTHRNQRPVQETLRLELGSSRSSSLALPPARVQQVMTVDELEAPTPEMKLPTVDMNLSAAIKEFGLAQLDGRPRLLTDLSIRFPDSLKQRGISTVKVQAQVVIDQTGAVTLRRLIDNPHAEIEPQLRAVMQRARFTPPEKDGQRVRAAFVWPLVLRTQ